MSATARIGWIGTGKIGAPMARRLLAAGHSLHAYDRFLDAGAELGAGKLVVAPDAASVARETDVVFTSLPDDAALDSLMLGSGSLPDLMRPGSILVETSTVSPTASARAAEALAASGIHYLRAPISGSTATAESGKLTVLASGPPAAMERVRPLMEAFAVRFFHVGLAEEARTLKLVLNMLVGATSALIAEALTFGRKGDLGIEQMLEVIGESVVASPLVAYKSRMLSSRDFTPAFTVSQMIKDFDLIGGAARETGAPVFLTALIRQHYEAARAQGHGMQDFFVLLEQYEALAGLGPLPAASATT